MNWGRLIDRRPQDKRPRICERLGTELLLQVNSDIHYGAVAKIQKSMKEEEGNLVDVEDRIAKIKDRLGRDPGRSAELDELQSDRLTIEKSIAAHNRLLRPGLVRSLPAEVLSMIFLYYILLCHLQAKANLDAAFHFGRATYKTMDLYVIAHNTAPLIPMSVCQRWRQIVMGDPCLWTMVSLSGRGKPERRSPQRKINMDSFTFPPSAAYINQLEILKLQMARANYRPLSIVLHLSSRHLIQRHLIPVLISTGLDAFPRAAEFHLDFNYINVPLRNYLLGNNLRDANHLHTLTVVFATELNRNTLSNGEMEITDLTRIFLTHTPNLQHLVLDIPPKAIEECVKEADVMDHLVELELRKPIDLHVFLVLLERAPALQVLKVFQVLESRRHEDMDGHAMHYFDNLSTLHVTWAENEQSNTMFNCITLPALRHLNISTYPTDSWPTASHVAFFERSGCMLHTLTVRESPINGRISELLVGQHELRELHLEHNPGDNWMPGSFDSDFRGFQSGLTMTALRFLTEDEDLRALRHLTISVASKQLEAVKKLLTARFVDAERRGRAKLESFCVFFNRSGSSLRYRDTETSFYDYGRPEKRDHEDDSSRPTVRNQIWRTATILTSQSEVTPPSKPEPNGYERLMEPFVDQGLRVRVEVRERQYYEEESSMPDE